MSAGDSVGAAMRRSLAVGMAGDGICGVGAAGGTAVGAGAGAAGGAATPAISSAVPTLSKSLSSMANDSLLNESGLIATMIVASFIDAMSFMRLMNFLTLS